MGEVLHLNIDKTRLFEMRANYIMIVPAERHGQKLRRITSENIAQYLEYQTHGRIALRACSVEMPVPQAISKIRPPAGASIRAAKSRA